VTHHFILALPAAAIIPLIGGLIGAAGSVAGGLLAPKPKAPPVPNVPPAPAPVQQPTGSQTSQTPTGTPSFLAAASAAPASQNVPGKTLLGQ
jgi:hypothetical protein